MFLKDRDAVLDYAVDWAGVTGAGRTVVESWMGSWWRKRLVAAFRWPGVERSGEA